MTNKLYTIGYEGRTAKEILDLLATHGVKRLLDVRYRPSSRKKGLSKTSLALGCARAGIQYFHDKDLGTPPDQMNAVRSGGGYDAQRFEEYRTFLLSKPKAIKNAQAIAISQTTCLLCYELSATDCHRSVVAEEVSKKSKLKVVHI